MKSILIILDDQFEKSEVYKDIGDYKNMSQLALSKKLPHWKNVFAKQGTLNYEKMVHLRNYCRDCDADVMFVTKKEIYPNSWRHYPMKTTAENEFWDFYKEQSRILLTAANKYFTETKTSNEKVQCSCGGHYQATNKAKHFNTRNHILNYNN